MVNGNLTRDKIISTRQSKIYVESSCTGRSQRAMISKVGPAPIFARSHRLRIACVNLLRSSARCESLANSFAVRPPSQKREGASATLRPIRTYSAQMSVCDSAARRHGKAESSPPISVWSEPRITAPLAPSSPNQPWIGRPGWASTIMAIPSTTAKSPKSEMPIFKSGNNIHDGTWARRNWRIEPSQLRHASAQWPEPPCASIHYFRMRRAGRDRARSFERQSCHRPPNSASKVAGQAGDSLSSQNTSKL